jgi:hypothetical protein
MEVGRYLDFHTSDGDTSDYTYRLDNTSVGILSASGSLSITNNIDVGGELNFTGASDKYVDFYTNNGVSNYTVYLRLLDNANTSFHSGITLTRGGAVTLFHNNTARLETSSSGITISGNVSATGGTITASNFSGSGALLTSIPNSATTATSSNTSSAIVARDASGNFSAGAITATSVSDSSGNLRSIPQNAKTSSYNLAASDNGKHISITTGGITVLSGTFSIGDTVAIYNDSSTNQTITQGAGVILRQAGTSNTGNRTLAQYGICTILCVASNTFVISGTGIS